MAVNYLLIPKPMTHLLFHKPTPDCSTSNKMEDISKKSDSVTRDATLAETIEPTNSDPSADQDPIDAGRSVTTKEAPDYMKAANRDSTGPTERLDHTAEHTEPTATDSRAVTQPAAVDSPVCHQPPDVTPCEGTPGYSAAPGPAALRRRGTSEDRDASMETVDGGGGATSTGDPPDGGRGVTSTCDLPDEVLDHLLTFVPPYSDLRSCRLVCRRWWHAVRRVERQLRRLLHRSLEELDVSWFHYDTPSPTHGGCPPQTGAHRVITKRCAHSAVMHDGRMYVFGGCSSRMTSFNDLWWLELGSLEWRRPQVVGAYPSPKAYASLVPYGDRLVLFGGWSQAAPYPLHQSWKLFDELHIYDTKECRWEEVRGVSSSGREEAALPGAPPQQSERWPPRMARHAASVHGHQMVVTGGLHQHHNSRFSATNEVWVFDLVTCEWRHQRCSSDPAPSARYGHSQIALDDRHMLMLGGSGGPNQLRQDAWLLELGAPSAEWRWRRLTVAGPEAAPSQLWCHPACQVGDRVVVLGRGRGDAALLSAAPAQPGAAPAQPGTAAARAPAAPVAAVLPGVRPAAGSPLGRAVAVVPGRPLAAGVGAGPGPSRGPAPPRLSSGRPETGSLSRRPSQDVPPPPPVQPPARPSIRPNAHCLPERRLAGLNRMQRRLEAAAAERAAPRPHPRCRPPLTAGYRLVAPAGRRPLTLHVLDVSGAISDGTVRWRQSRRQEGPDERILYSLVAARGELVLFGGIVTPPRAAEQPETAETNNAFNAVSLVTIPCHMFH